MCRQAFRRSGSRTGETAFWGGYAQVNDGWAPGSNGNDPNNPCPGSPPLLRAGGNLGGIPADSILKPGTFVNIGVPVEITGSEVDRWFLALDQGFESAAFHLYAAYQHFNADLDLVTRDLSVSPQRQAEERWRIRSTISTCSTPAGASTSNPGPPFEDTLETALRGGLFLCCATGPEASSICGCVATDIGKLSKSPKFNSDLTAHATRLKSPRPTLILQAESRPCGKLRLRPA